MDRCWFLTWTTYGTWLPGDARGFVSPIWDDEKQRLVVHNQVGTDVDRDMPALVRTSLQKLKGPPIYLDIEQAECAAKQFEETAHYRQWRLLAYAVMRNHVHLCVGVSDDPEPENILRDFKSYASRSLNKQWRRPASGTWWTESGSKRKVKLTDEDVGSVVKYIREQEFPLIVWTWDDRKV